MQCDPLHYPDEAPIDFTIRKVFFRIFYEVVEGSKDININ